MTNRRHFLRVVAASGGFAMGGKSAVAGSKEDPIGRPSSAEQLKVGLMQALPAGSNQERNWEIAERHCRQAACQNVDLILMPEMWNIGYQGIANFAGEQISKWQSQAIATNGPWVQRFRDLARELNIAIAVTYLEAWPEKPRNTISLINRHGDIVLTYAKVHTCDFAFEAALTPGDAWNSVDLDTLKGVVQVGAMICFDREFPESMRSLMLAGAEVVLTPNACPLDELRLAQFRVRAYENATAVAIANYPAPIHNGQSTVFDAAGTRRVVGVMNEALVTTSINLRELRSYRQKTIWGNAWRRPHRYGALSEPVDLPVFQRNDAYGHPFDARQR